MKSPESAATPGAGGAASAPRLVTLTLNPAIDVSATVETVMPDDKLRCEAPVYEPGGGGINVARAIRKLGGDALAVFPAGGPAGALLEALLDAEGVACRTLPIAGWTRENLNVSERRTRRQFRFVMPGPPLRECDWQPVLDVLAALDPVPGYLVASGSLPPGVPADFYARVARWAAGAGVRLVVDASGEPLRRAALARPYLLKPSQREFAEQTGEADTGEARLPALAGRLVADGRCEVLVLSLGPRGVLWASATGQGRLAAPPVCVRSSVGAGDSMVAGIVLALARGRPLAEAIRFGVAAGAAAVMNPGTELCRAGDVARLYPAVSEVPAGG
jgi:6-phosphofructokinase 2